MGTAVAVHEPAERPGWLEKLLVLAICAGLFAAVHVADQRGRERNEVRAREVLAERAQRAAEPTRRPGRDDPAFVLPGGVSFGASPSVIEAPAAAGTRDGRDDVGAILLLLMGAAGLSMCGAGLRLLSRPSA